MSEYIVALDPGTTTGVACHLTSTPLEDGLITQLQQDGVWDFLKARHNRHGPAMVIVYESFAYRRLPKAVLTPVEVIGIIKEFGRQYKVRLVAQTPAQGKFYWTDDKLKARGLWTPGKKHAMDALRHLLTYEKVYV